MILLIDSLTIIQIEDNGFQANGFMNGSAYSGKQQDIMIFAVIIF